jgi:hypothetical protein
MSVDEAAAWAANSEVESLSNPSTSQHHNGPGRGLFQWEKLGRAKDFEAIFKIPIENSTRAQQHAFREWELSQHTFGTAKRLIDSAVGAGAKAEAISRRYLRPGKEQLVKDRTAADRANIAEAIIRRISPGK